MAATRYLFGNFTLDADERQLSADGRTIALNARYFDALLLMLRHPGTLIDKDRFNEEVWHAAPVTDEALTQCIRTLRRALGDKAAAPVFIETVPRHGYRFIAEVREAENESEGGEQFHVRSDRVPLDAALGGAAAGVIGGTIYGLAALPDGAGGLSALLVLLIICAGVGAIAGWGIGFGIWFARRQRLAVSVATVLGAMLGGLAVGALFKLVGLDAFALIFGKGPSRIAGAGEGAVLGAVIGMAVTCAQATRLPAAIAGAGVAGLALGATIAFAGGRLMAGSLAELSRAFPGNGFRLDRIGALFGEPGFGPLSLTFTTAFEGLLFCLCTTASLLLLPRRSEAGHERLLPGGKHTPQTL